MERFCVVEAEEGIGRAIRREVERVVPGREARVSPVHPALLVVSPGAVRRGLRLPGACRTVLLPGDGGALLAGVRAASAVSYGTSPRDSLTVSSREGDRLWAALQRELVTVDGHVVERQEFPLSFRAGRDELPALAVAGALLLLGIPPEALGRQ